MKLLKNPRVLVWLLLIIWGVLALVRMTVGSGTLVSDFLLLGALLLLIPKDDRLVDRHFTVQGRCIVAAVLEVFTVILWMI